MRHRMVPLLATPLRKSDAESPGSYETKARGMAVLTASASRTTGYTSLRAGTFALSMASKDKAGKGRQIWHFHSNSGVIPNIGKLGNDDRPTTRTVYRR